MKTLYVINDPIARAKFRPETGERVINSGWMISGEGFDHVEVVDLPPKWKLESINFRQYYRDWFNENILTHLNREATVSVPVGHEELVK